MKKTLVFAAMAAFSAAGIVAGPGFASAGIINPPSVPPVPPAVQQQVDRVRTDWFDLHTGELYAKAINAIQPVCNALGFQCY